jgi:hypothetical protein
MIEQDGHDVRTAFMYVKQKCPAAFHAEGNRS